MNRNKATNSGKDEVWRTILLSDEILVRSVHPHKLIKNKTPAGGDKAPTTDNGSEDEYESGWLCDGSNKFKGGCKSGQTEFGEHLGTDFWSSEQQDCDFDLCEMCIRWCIHCEKNNLDIGWVDPSAPGEPLVAQQQESEEAYETSR